MRPGLFTRAPIRMKNHRWSILVVSPEMRLHGERTQTVALVSCVVGYFSWVTDPETSRTIRPKLRFKEVRFVHKSQYYWRLECELKHFSSNLSYWVISFIIYLLIVTWLLNQNCSFDSHLQNSLMLSVTFLSKRCNSQKQMSLIISQWRF